MHFDYHVDADQNDVILEADKRLKQVAREVEPE